MYKILILLFLPLSSIFAQSKTSWKVYELFSNENIPLRTEDIQQYLPGYTLFKIQSNERKASVHALIDLDENVNALIYSSPDYKNRTTRLVIPTPISTPEILKAYREDRSFRLGERQKSELLELISHFTILTYQPTNKETKPVLVSSDLLENEVIDSADQPENAAIASMDQPANAVVAATEIISEPIALSKIQAKGPGDKMIQPSCKIDLQNRKLMQQDQIIKTTELKGNVALKICVAKDGSVLSAKFTQKGSTSLDPQLIEMAKSNAQSLKFDPQTMDSQCGTITYFF